jgi:signal transduction histidine kinase
VNNTLPGVSNDTIKLDPLNCEIREGILRIEVEDTGIGIKKEKIKKLFKPYSTADKNS